ncbi:MAG: hypothetical protein J4432_05030 [DPANN group archaeon]|nr:hypothetical protein [DPANN group archaeon]
MKPYPPTLMDNDRYIQFTVHSDKKFKQADVWKAIYKIAKENIGLKGIADANLALIDFNETEQKGLIRTNTKSIYIVKGVTSMLAEIESTPAFIQTLRVTGTIKKSRGV